MLRLRTEGIIAAAGTGGPPDVDRPETYNDFVGVGSSTNYANINAAWNAGERLIFLREGSHSINNPITINTNEPVYIHGFADKVTTLKCQNLGQPMFIIQNCPLLSFQRVLLDVNGTRGANASQVGLKFQNTAETRLEMLHCTLQALSINIEGPGDFVGQNLDFNMHGTSQAGIFVDHPGASLYFMNGHGPNNSATVHLLQSTTTEIYHIWQKRGHVELYYVLTGASRGLGADFRFDTRSPKGCHVIAGARSEGVKNTQYPGGSAHADDIFSHMVFVPSTTEEVDLLIIGNHGAWVADLKDPTEKVVPNAIRYNGRGTVWMFANDFSFADHLISGTATNATMIGVGNLILRDEVMDVTGASTVVSAGNLQNQFIANRELGEPVTTPIAFADGTSLLGSFGTLPEPPARQAFPTIGIPRVETLHAFMELVNVKTVHGAVGNGTTDDTTALQNAINADGDRLFFPAGTYRTTGQLAHHYDPTKTSPARTEPGSTAFHGFVGGWWAGAGQDTTKIQNTAIHTTTNPARCLITGGMGAYQLQDIAFQTNGNNADCVHLSRQTNFSPSVHSTRNTFIRCSFINGQACLGIANDFGIVGGNINSESFLMMDCLLQNGTRGLDNGRDNALGNTLFGCTIEDCTFAMRSNRAHANMFECTLTDNGQDFQEMAFTYSHYYAGLTSNSPDLWLQTGGFTNDWYLPIWHGCTWTNLPAGVRVVELDYGGGPTFLQCSMNSGLLFLSNDLPSLKKVALKLWSTVAEWDASKNQPNQTSAMYHSTD